MNPSIFGVYGKSDSGKTQLIVNIINRLFKEGYKVASVKISEKNITINSKGKDTWRHAQAGADLVVFSSEKETDFFIKKPIDFIEIINSIKLIGQYDIILVEGANDENIPKIRVGDINERKNTITTYKNNFEELICKIKAELIRRK